MEIPVSSSDLLLNKITDFIASLEEDGIRYISLRVLCSHSHLKTDIPTERVEIPRKVLNENTGEFEYIVGGNGIVNQIFNMQTIRGFEPYLYDIELCGS